MGRPLKALGLSTLLTGLLSGTGPAVAQAAANPAKPALSDAARVDDARDTMRAERLQPAERIVLDGALNHPAWQRAQPHRSFVAKDPTFGAAPPQRTEFRVLFDEQALYVGVVAHDDAPRFFRVNAAGSTGDGLHTAADDSQDFSPDFDWDAAVARQVAAPGGWTVVLRLPFASLRYAPGDHDWRILVGRRLPRANFHLMTSA